MEIISVTEKDPSVVTAYFADGSNHDTAMFLAVARQKYPADQRLFDPAILQEVKQGYYYWFPHPFGWNEISFEQWDYPGPTPLYYKPGVYLQF